MLERRRETELLLIVPFGIDSSRRSFVSRSPNVSDADMESKNKLRSERPGWPDYEPLHQKFFTIGEFRLPRLRGHPEVQGFSGKYDANAIIVPQPTGRAICVFMDVNV